MAVKEYWPDDKDEDYVENGVSAGVIHHDISLEVHRHLLEKSKILSGLLGKDRSSANSAQNYANGAQDYAEDSSGKIGSTLVKKAYRDRIFFILPVMIGTAQRHSPKTTQGSFIRLHFEGCREKRNSSP